MILAQLLFQYEFNLVPSCGSFHDTSTKTHTGVSYISASSPWLLYRGEIFILVRKLIPLLCKHSTTVCSNMKSCSHESGTGSTPLRVFTCKHTLE